MAKDQIEFMQIYGAVSCIVGGATPAEVATTDPLATAAELIAERSGFAVDRKQDRESAVRALLEALGRENVELTLEARSRLGASDRRSRARDGTLVGAGLNRGGGLLGRVVARARRPRGVRRPQNEES